MRPFLLAVVCLAGCIIKQQQDPFPPPDEPLPSGNPECNRTCDPDEVCARDHGCYPPTRVRGVRTEWTIGGAPASETACAGLPDLYIRYEASDDSLGYSPIPCRLGLFNMDKLPESFFQVELGFDAADRFGGVTRTISDGTVVIDLNP